MNNNYPYPPPECNPDVAALDGYPENFGKKEARIGLAVAAAMKAADCCGGGNGGSGDILPQGTRTEFSTTVGTTNIELFPADAGRTYIRLQNLSCELMYVRFGDVASPTNSYLLHPGGYLEDQVTQELTQSINILGTEAAGSAVYGFVLSTT